MSIFSYQFYTRNDFHATIVNWSCEIRFPFYWVIILRYFNPEFRITVLYLYPEQLSQYCVKSKFYKTTTCELLLLLFVLKYEFTEIILSYKTHFVLIFGKSYTVYFKILHFACVIVGWLPIFCVRPYISHLMLATCVFTGMVKYVQRSM